MLKSRKSDKNLERYVAILSEDLGEALAESFVVRHFSEVEEADLAGVVEKLRSGLLSFMTPAEFAELKRRIESEGGERAQGALGIDAGR